MMSTSSPQDAPSLAYRQYGLGVAGMLLGATVGCVVFVLLLRAGFYGVMLVGLCTGWGCSSLSRMASKLLGVGCVLVALPATIGVSWYTGPFVADDSLGFYLRNLHQLNTVQLIMMGLGLVMAFYLGKGRG